MVGRVPNEVFDRVRNPTSWIFIMPNKTPSILLFALGALLCLLMANASYAGWSENVRLTYRGNEISPQVIARNDTVNVVWEEMGASNVFYIRSTDGGGSWGPIIQLNDSSHWAYRANLNLAESGLLVTWFDNNTIEGFTSIGIGKSSNGGGTWSAPSYAGTDNPNHFGNPVSAVKGDSIFLAYHSNRNDSTGIPPLRALHSYNYGATWSDEVTVGHPLSIIPQPMRLRYCNGSVLLAASCVPDSDHLDQYYIIGYISSDAERSWSDTIWISPDIPYAAQNLCLSNNKFAPQFITAYLHDRYAIYSYHGDVFQAISNDGGFTWPNEYQATNNHTAWFPQIDFVADTLITV
jgi:hypothetical protein